MTKMVKAMLNGEFEIIIPEHRAARPEWYSEDGWEKARLETLYGLIKNQIELDGISVVYYVGAEEGEMPALCQMWGAKVLLFEPNPKVWSNTRAIWEANKLKTPYCFEGFASNEDKLLQEEGVFLAPSWPQSAYNEIEAAHGFKELHLEGGNYSQIKLDTVEGLIHVPPTIITMDVEGSEFEVLKGSEAILKKYKPDIVLSLHPEFLFHQWGVYGAEVRGWIKNIGYKETLLDYQHEVHLLYEAIDE